MEVVFSHKGKGKDSRLNEVGVIGLLALFSVGMLNLCGDDGWLRFPMLRWDNSWYFMAGKAWMAGLLPYHDFADSKGPLLWLLYGLGYLISNHNYYGVLVIETVCYTATFYILYRLALLFVKDRPRALVASMAMAFLFFFPGMHLEIKTEDFCQPFMATGFYVLIQTVYFRRFRKKYATWMGISLGALLMLKFSYCLTLGTVATGILLFLICKRENIRDFLLYCIGGFVGSVAPFIAYFLFTGTLGEFMKEYFLNTGQTIINVKTETDIEAISLKDTWPFKIYKLWKYSTPLCHYMRISAVATIASIIYLKKGGWTAWIVGIWYALSILLLSVAQGDYYFMAVAVCGYGGIVWATSYLKKFSTALAALCGGIILCLLTLFNTYYSRSGFNDLTYQREVQKEHKKIASIINQRERETGRRPTIVYLHGWDSGEHIESNAIPGAKYWCQQVGMTQEMLRQHEEDVWKNRPDFVVVFEGDSALREALTQHGYEPVVRYHPRPEAEIYQPDVCWLYVRKD